jgi:hypothetical protein
VCGNFEQSFFQEISFEQTSQSETGSAGQAAAAAIA